MKQDTFQRQLLKHSEDFRKIIETPSGDWSVKGFIDIAKNIYTISVDTKVISKFEIEPTNDFGIFPKTRYQGSKNKILDWISYSIKDLNFCTVLDAFGGTGSVGYMLKKQGKQVFYNDYLKFNYIIGLALIENNNTFLDDDDLNFILQKHDNINYPTFIYDTFHDIYFTDEENLWLDQVITNISEWVELIDYESKHKKIKNGKNEWCNKGKIHTAFQNLFNKFQDSILIVSYRDDGIPTTQELVKMLNGFGKQVEVKKIDYKYVLSNGNSKEVLIIAK